MTATCEVRAFGPMEIRHAGVGTVLTSRRQQVLLGMLVVRRGSVVPVATLIDALWPERLPVTARKSIHIHVHRLRRALADSEAVQHRPPGYALSMSPADVDVYQFEELTQRGRAALVSGDTDTAVRLFRRAADLHRGPAFQGLEEVNELAIEAQRLGEVRLAAVEDRIAAELQLDRCAELVPELEALVTEHPLRERFRAQLMVALYRAGRKADALAVYRRGRQVLVEELGIEPNQECQELARAILADDPLLWRSASPAAPVVARPPPAPRPRQLPADPPGFTGRSRQLRRLDVLLRAARSHRPPASLICAVDGSAGVGKTALAVRWAHRVAGQFPDGQLYANLRGHAAGAPVGPERVLAAFLRALGVPVERVPSDLDEAAAAYRSRLAGRQVLVLLDDAGSADQVRPLLPGDGGCAVLVTSREWLTGLVARDGARRLALDVLPAGEARALLSRAMGAHRVRADPAAVAELVERCGRLPLALRIAAANLTGGGRSIADYLVRIRTEDRLTVLAVPGEEQTAVAAAFAQSYRRLPAPARRMFRLFGLAAGTGLTTPAAAALADSGPVRTQQELDRLARAHLVEEHSPGRYSCHDLLRAYASDRAGAEDSAADRAAAVARLHRYYLRRADVAAALLHPHTLRLPGDRGSDVGTVEFEDPGGAVRWLDVELPNLLAVARQAATAGDGETVWMLADALRSFLLQRGNTTDGRALADAALMAAAAAGDRRAFGCALLGRAGLSHRQGRGHAAIEDLTAALSAFRDVGWREGQAAVLANLGSVHSQLGRLPEAATHLAEALHHYDRLDHRYGQLGVVTNLAVTLLELGRLREAAAHAERAVAGLAGRNAGPVGPMNQGTLAEIRRLLGDFGAARRSVAEALAGYREIDDRSAEGGVLLCLAMIHCDTGHAAPALELAESALRVARDTDHRGREANALVALTVIRGRYGEPGSARRTGTAALALTTEIDDLHGHVEALVALAELGAEGTDPGPARGWADDALETARQSGFRLLEGLVLTAAAGISLATGDAGRAAAEASRALAVHTETGHVLGMIRTHDLLVRIHAGAGRLAAAHRHRRRSRSLAARLAGRVQAADWRGGGPPGAPLNGDT